MRRVEMGGEKRNVYVTVAFAGVAMMVAMLVGVVVIRRRSSRYPQHQVTMLSQHGLIDLYIVIPCFLTKHSPILARSLRVGTFI